MTTPIGGFLHQDVANEGDEILAYCYPPANPILDAMKGVLHTCEDFGRKYSDSDVDTVHFTVSTTDVAYRAQFHWFAEFLFVLLLPVSQRSTEQTAHNFFSYVVELLNFMWQSVGQMIADTDGKEKLDAFFRQLFTRYLLSCHSTETTSKAFFTSFSAFSVPYLPLGLLDQTSQLLMNLEASDPIFPPSPSSTATAFGIHPCGDGPALYTMLGSLMTHRGMLLKSLLCLPQTEGVLHFLHFSGLTERHEGDGELVIMQEVFVIDYDSHALDFVAEHPDFHRTPPSHLTPTRERALLLTVSRDSLIVAALLKPDTTPILSRAIPDWLEACRLCMERFVEAALPAIRDLENHPHPPLRMMDATQDIIAWNKAKTKDMRQTPDPGSVIDGPYNVLLHYLLHQPNTCHVVFPLVAPINHSAGPSAVLPALILKHLSQNFAAITIQIREVVATFGTPIDATGPESQQMEQRIEEYGIHVVERGDDQSVLFGYWVVGVWLEDGSECFVCYEDSIPQCARDIALRLLLETS